MALTLSSPVFKNGELIPSKYTCDRNSSDGEINPPLEISGVDAKVASLVLIMEDPDVPKSLREDGMWDHWIKFNIPPGITEIQEGMEPPGVSGIGTSGNFEYHGPCPPDGEHRYFFKLYALDTDLDLAEGSTKKQVLKAMEGHVLQETELMGVYSRNI